MRIAFATSLIPLGTPSTGYDIANRAVIDGLRALGHEVVAVGYVDADAAGLFDPRDPNTISLGPVSVANATASKASKLVWLARALRNRTTFAGAKLQNISADRLAEILREAGPFDAVIVNGVTLAAAFERVLTERPFLYVAHNVEHQSARENAEATTGFERWMFAREATLLKALEERLCSAARHVWTLSEEDMGPLDLTPEKATVLELLTGAIPPSTGLRQPSVDATLIGTWSWVPNRIGLDWFLNEVTPHLPSSFRFDVAGRTPTDVRLNHPGGRLVGRVPDAGAFVATGAVVPLISRAGTGVQLKTIETLELGLPAVATSLSMRGIATKPKNWIVTDDPQAFADALVTLAADRRAGRIADLDGTAVQSTRKARLQDGLKRGFDSFERATGPVVRQVA